MNRTQSILSLTIVGLISGLAIWQAIGVAFDYDFGRFFPVDHPQTEAYLSFREEFGHDVNYLLIGLENEEGIFEEGFLQQVAALTESLEGLSYFTEVRSPTNISYPVRDPLFGAFSQVPYLNWDQTDTYPADSQKIYQTPNLIGTHFAANGKAVSLILIQQPELSEEACAKLVEEVDIILSQFSFDQVHLAGRCVGQTYYTGLMQREVIVFVGASVALIAFFLALLFRSLIGVIVPLIIVGLSVVWTVALMRLTDQPLDVISNVIPSIILVVGISAVIHILAHYREQLTRLPTREALSRALRQVGTANVMTALTTALGFLTLLTAAVRPIEAFGLYATLGVLIAFLLTYAILPALLPWLPGMKGEKVGRNKLDQGLQNALQAIIRHRKLTLIGTGILTLLSLWGASHLRVNNHLLEDLREDNPLQQDFVFYEEAFSGARSFELLLTKPESLNWGDRNSWVPVDSLEQYLQETYGIGNLISPQTFIKSLNQAWEVGSTEGYELPSSDRRFNQIWRTLMRAERQTNLQVYMQNERIRISGLMPDLGSEEILKRDKALETWFAAHIPEGYRYELTGLPPLLDTSNRLVASNVLTGLVFALLLTAMLMGLIFRSGRMVFIALIPNLLPLLWIGGLMGAFGIDLKLSTSIIFAISFGIAVDDTIHFMNRLRWELAAGRSLLYAIKRSFLSTGRAILLTTFILASGFMMLTLSDFLGTFFIGLLVSLTLIFALVADLVLLPVLLWYFWSNEKKE